MTLNYKIDENNIIYLLYCSEVKLKKTEKSNKEVTID